MKTCTACLEDKTFSEFRPRNDRPGKFYARCKKCLSKACAMWHKNNVDKQKATYRRWASANPARHAFNFTRRMGLMRFPTENPVTTLELVAMYDKQGGRCALSGIEMTFGKAANGRSAKPTNCSLDRIDQTKGYELGNIRLICYAINSFRGSMSDPEMYEMLRKFSEFSGVTP